MCSVRAGAEAFEKRWRTGSGAEFAGAQLVGCAVVGLALAPPAEHSGLPATHRWSSRRVSATIVASAGYLYGFGMLAYAGAIALVAAAAALPWGRLQLAR